MKKYSLPKLDYGYNALEPVISSKIMELHYSKHHAAYVKGTNAAIEELEKIRNNNSTASTPDILRKLSFNLNGHILHDLFWKNMCPPKEDNAPEGKILDAINSNFNSFEAFQKQFSDAAISVEGSGWAALATDGKENLLLTQIEKHNLMHIAGYAPILVLDVWEHAYYLDYQNKRPEFVKNFWKAVNWQDVEKRL
ncbi:MAG: superoxide dismutase [Candidatus Micrarchaeota archaeon]